MHVYWGNEVSFHVFLTPAIGWSEGSALRSGHFILEEGIPGTTGEETDMVGVGKETNRGLPKGAATLQAHHPPPQI
jgi:hypothetical protein